ncbi:hypothetical protein M5K25_012536 [Dendrobium thyrsiflorum]|uniref:Uncharacterized protein n=1 Tax=Dendrobium thyrsiflorum TaxID=117978 RepID=A0ABD0V507_DENTH
METARSGVREERVPLSFNKSFSATVTRTCSHFRSARLGALSATGFLLWSSIPSVSGKIYFQKRSWGARKSGSVGSEPTGTDPQKKGWIKASPLMANPSAAARSATWWAMFDPALSPATKTRLKSPC